MVAAFSTCALLALCRALSLTSAAAGPRAPELFLTPVHYELNLRLDYGEEQLGGTARVTLENVGLTAAAEVQILLYRLMEVSAVRASDG